MEKKDSMNDENFLSENEIKSLKNGKCFEKTIDGEKILICPAEGEIKGYEETSE